MNVSVIMAGGGGTRLWPASLRARPKQLMAFGEDRTLLAATAERMRDFAASTICVTTRALADDVARVLPDAAILAEPVGRNTAPALGLAALTAEQQQPGCVLGCVPADQHIADRAEFARVARLAGQLAAEHDTVVTVGIVPTRAETGFGYLELGEAVGPARRVRRFVEKPDAATAAGYLAGGNHLWNAGMFFVSARRLLAAIRAHLPALADGLDRLAAGATLDEVYPTLPAISIDHGVMEKLPGILTVPGNFGWNDVGAWSALPDVLPADAHGNHVGGGARAVSHEATGNVVYGDPGTAVALVGVKDLVVVRSGHRVLVMPRDRAQDVKHITAMLPPEDL